MSADPVTLAIASTVVQAVGTYQGIQAQKAQNKAIIREYETEKKYNQLKGLQDSNDVLEEARRKRKQNLAIVAGSGYSDTSRHFLSTQTEIDRIAAKDVSNIKINTLRGESKIETQIYTTKVMGKAQEFGAYANIAASAFKTGAYAKSYKGNPQGGQYDLSNTNKMDDN
jgi:mannitol-specific phosphotransferase system IIBC component